MANSFQLRHKVRFVTAASLFDGHDAAIHIMRRILQAEGAEVIHLGHNRSVQEVVEAAIQEDVQAIAASCYQGGHVEYFSYMVDLLKEKGASHIRVYGGGGGVIVPEEIKLLHARGVARIFSPDDGIQMGLVGMIRYMLQECDHYPSEPCATLPMGFGSADKLAAKDIAQLLTTLELAEDSKFAQAALSLQQALASSHIKPCPVIGITGTGGAGKSSLIDEILLRFLQVFADRRIAVLSVDPTRKKTGGALLGDRIRMNALRSPRIYMRSMATRQANRAISAHTKSALELLKLAGFDAVILETSGIGQSDDEVKALSDVSLYVMTPEYGAGTQLEKIAMLDEADVVAVNKFDKKGALDALRDVRKQYQRNHQLFDKDPALMPVFGTNAHHFNDLGTNQLFNYIFQRLLKFDMQPLIEGEPVISSLLPVSRTRYLGDIVDTMRSYHQEVETQAALATRVWALEQASQLVPQVKAQAEKEAAGLSGEAKQAITSYKKLKEELQTSHSSYAVRGKRIQVENNTESLSQIAIPKVCAPELSQYGDQVRFMLLEGFPGYFPYTAGVFPFKRTGEDPTRMFAGEGGPERTNKRFHYLSLGQPATRLSTAFDSVTLYGSDPSLEPDNYGKVGNAGVSVCTLDDAKRLYSGFDLCAANTSVSMTINGPAPTVLAFYFNAAIDAECEKRLRANGQWQQVEARIEKWFADKGLPRPVYRAELPQGHNQNGLGFLGLAASFVVEPSFYNEVKQDVLKTLRGTVQADILKEDQAQNTCIFSTEFAMRMMGDVQSYFSAHGVNNFYSVSISGYHIAEAGANPITQLAFTLANGFTIVEYYRSRGLDIDRFAQNLSFFFSNGLDPEYSVIGRVARRIWAIAMRDLYHADERSQKLKYHIQTSGRSLHAQEMAFNDIRTTLQALYAISDNCNSLHTNAYDEAVTTPTEESVRRAMAIQLVINKELGLMKNENPLQGSYFIEYMTKQVEEAVLKEFEALDMRGGVLGAMETMYQRSKIQEESMVYEHKKHTGELPIIGVNTFLNENAHEQFQVKELIRSTESEKNQQVTQVADLAKRFQEEQPEALLKLQRVAQEGGNIFEELLETTKVCSLGMISEALYAVGGAYRRNM